MGRRTFNEETIRKINLAIYAAAMNLVKSSAGTLTVQGLKEEITNQQGIVDKVNKEFAEETDSTKRLALQLTAKNEADSVNEKTARAHWNLCGMPRMWRQSSSSRLSNN